MLEQFAWLCHQDRHSELELEVELSAARGKRCNGMAEKLRCDHSHVGDIVDVIQDIERVGETVKTLASFFDLLRGKS